MAPTSKKAAGDDLAAEVADDLAVEPPEPEPEPVEGRYELQRPFYINDRFYARGSVIQLPKGIAPPSTAKPTGKKLFNAPLTFI